MPIGTINAAKELPQTYQPLLLTTFTFHEGTVLRLCTHGLSVAAGGFQYGGEDYLDRIIRFDIGATQQQQAGVFTSPTSSVTLNDADWFLYTNYELPIGFAGAEMEQRLVFWDMGVEDFSTDSIVRFVGRCDSPRRDSTELVVRASSRLNLSRTALPILQVQPTCPWGFPTSAAERADALNNEDSPHWECGYSPDQPGGVGNLDGGAPFEDCNRTKADCVARGMYERDRSLSITGRFGGVQWRPPKNFRGRSFATRKWVDGQNTGPEGKYGDPVPLIYGTAWVEPPVVNNLGDGENTSRFEVLVGYGEVDRIVRVVVNDKEVPAATGMDHSSLPVDDPNFAWYLVNRGDRNGAPNLLPGYTDTAGTPLGDPYGSLCVIVVVVPHQLVPASAVPRVQVLVQGPKIRAYTAPAAFSDVGFPQNRNLVWALLDISIWLGWKYNYWNIQSLLDAAAIAEASINYENLFGGTSSHPRFYGSLTLERSTDGAEIVRRLLAALRGVLVPNTADGTIKLVIKQTLADQQPAPVPGSNYDTPVASFQADGTVANGYVAYRFDESTIALRDTSDDATTATREGQGRRVTTSLRFLPTAGGDVPNIIRVSFQDEDDNFAPTTLTVADTERIGRVGREVETELAVLGVTSMDHARRSIALKFAEGFRGNTRVPPIGDAGGTVRAALDSSVRVVHLNIADIVVVHLPEVGLNEQLFRLERISPRGNFERVELEMSLHNDRWCLDSFGQEAPPLYGDDHYNQFQRPPYAAFVDRRDVNGAPDALYGEEVPVFPLREQSDLAGLPAEESYPVLTLRLPVNSFSADIRRPRVPIEGTTATTGGSLAGGRDYWVSLVAVEGSGLVSPPSGLVRVFVPAGTSTNTISVPNLSWDAATAEHIIYVGTDPWRLHNYARTAGAPSSITFAGPLYGSNIERLPIPDSESAGVKVRIYRAIHAGVWANLVGSATSTTMTFPAAGFGVDEWAGRTVLMLGRTVFGQDLPAHFSWRVVSNTAETITFSAGLGPDILAALDPGTGLPGLVAMLPQATTFSASTIGDAQFDNVLAVESSIGLTGATNATPIAITTASDHGYSTGDRVRLDGVAGNTAANGVWDITVTGADTFTLDSSAGNGTFTPGGIVRRLTGGLAPDSCVGCLVRIIAGMGRGQTRRIESHNATTLTVSPDWTTTPDSTSIFTIVQASPALEQDLDVRGTAQLANNVEHILDIGGLEQTTLEARLVGVDGAGDETPESATLPFYFYLFNRLGPAATNSGGTLSFVIPSTIAVLSNATSALRLDSGRDPMRALALLGEASVNGDVSVSIRVAGAEWLALTIPEGSLEIEADSAAIAAAGHLPADTNIWIDVTGVGLDYPGTDLSVLIHL